MLIFLPGQRRKSEEEQRVRQMALQVERDVYRLYGRSQVETDTDTRDALSILRSLNGLLENVLKQQTIAKQEIRREQESVQQSTPVTIQKQALPPEPSTTAKELIDLRDRFLLAKPKEGDMIINADVLDVFYHDLGAILTNEGITSLEEVGCPYNQERQHIIDTQVTHDPAQQSIVCKTESPGYLFNKRLIRPQEVILYKLQEHS